MKYIWYTDKRNIEVENNIEQLLRPNVILKNCLTAGKRNFEDKHKEFIWKGRNRVANNEKNNENILQRMKVWTEFNKKMNKN